MDDNKLPERRLDYVDSLADNMGKLSDDKRIEVAGMFDRLVAGYSSMLAFIRSEKESLDGQLSEDLTHGDANLINPEEVISFGEGLIEFYRNYARVILIELDVITAFKYLRLSENDWDYRFFARRLYTLMHETKIYLEKHVKRNAVLNDLRKVGDSKLYDNVNDARDRLLEFFKNHDGSFYEVRNAGEAHKDADIYRQFRAIEDLSVKESYGLISSFFDSFNEYLNALVLFHGSLDKYNATLRKRSVMIQGSGLIGMDGPVTIESIDGASWVNGIHGIMAFQRD